MARRKPTSRFVAEARRHPLKVAFVCGARCLRLVEKDNLRGEEPHAVSVQHNPIERQADAWIAPIDPLVARSIIEEKLGGVSARAARMQLMEWHFDRSSPWQWLQLAGDRDSKVPIGQGAPQHMLFITPNGDVDIRVSPGDMPEKYIDGPSAGYRPLDTDSRQVGTERDQVWVDWIGHCVPEERADGSLTRSIKHSLGFTELT